MNDDNFLEDKLDHRRNEGSFRTLKPKTDLIDFCSNDYLGIVRNNLLQRPGDGLAHGSTGSRLLTGNSLLTEQVEGFLANFHQAEAALIFNSGYDANIGLLSAVPQKGDTIIYDFLSHASIRDGVRLSFAHAFSFGHNDLQDLEKKLQSASGRIFVVTESVFSMDGDMAPLAEISEICRRHQAHLIIDEAHATGVIGERGEGLVQRSGLAEVCFARVHTFGKALGCHGAVVLGSARLRGYLINFSRAFIYTTALPDYSIHAIQNSYELFPLMKHERQHLHDIIDLFQSSGTRLKKLISQTPVQAVILAGNAGVKTLARHLHDNGIDARPILYPTVPKGSERLRIVLHSFNTIEQVELLLSLLK